MTIGEQAVRKTLFAFVAACATLWFAAAAQARVDISVDLSTQTMQVTSSTGTYRWPVSTARAGFSTPRGTYRVQRMEVLHLSHKYHNSPMPHSLFFKGGYAIHGSYATASLGAPASHGCIRLAPGNAAALYTMVRAEGARITILGRAPATETRYAALGKHRAYAQAATHRHIAQGSRIRPQLRGTQDDVGEALGYAPVRSPDFSDWMANPAGF